MHAPRIEVRLAEKLHRQARAERWGVSVAAFAQALEATLERAPDDSQRKPEPFLRALHLEDLALATACAAGHEPAWEHFIREYRPALYRAADALAPGGGARDLADGLYAELYGLTEREGERRSLFRYFHGRSALATWLRAVLAQRFVDRVRVERRTEPMPDEEPGSAAAPVVTEPGEERYLELVHGALGKAVTSLAPRDRLRLAAYYAQELTLAQVGRLLGEHESTVSRQLSRTRAAIRELVEHELSEEGLSPDEIDRGFELVTEDAGAFDLSRLVESVDRKDSGGERSS